MQLPKKPEKNSGLKRDLIPRCSNQLGYEATDVRSQSIMRLYAPVKENVVIDVYEINHIRTAEMKSNEE